MKQLIYIYLIISFSALSCTDAPERWDESGGKEISLDVSLYIPEFNTTLGRAVSDENAVRDMWLLTFDAQGLFLARLHATDLVARENGGIGTGEFKVKLPEKTRIIHFIANHDEIISFDDRAALQKDERELIPVLAGGQLMFWGRA